jgi:hypothetical protein
MTETNERAASRRQLREAGVLRTQTPPPSEPFVPDGVSSVNEILERARAMRRVYEGTADPETLGKARGEYWEHPVWGRLFIGPMPAVGYAELERAAQSSLNRKRYEDLVYLHRGILAPQFSAEQITELYESGDGPATQDIIAAIRRWNPTFDEKQDYLTACIGSSRLLLMFLTAAINSNLWPALAELLDSEGDLTEEQAAKKVMFERLLRFLPFMASVMEIGKTADEMEVPLTVAGAVAAREAQQRLVESGARLPNPGL